MFTFILVVLLPLISSSEILRIRDFKNTTITKFNFGKDCDVRSLKLYGYNYCFCQGVRENWLDDVNEIRSKSLKNIRLEYTNEKPNHHFEITRHNFAEKKCALFYLSKVYDLHGVVILTKLSTKTFADDIMKCKPSPLFSQHILNKKINSTYIQEELLLLKITDAKTFIILCELECAALVLQASVRVGMDDEEYVWITMHSTVIFTGQSLPPNLMTIAETHENNRINTSELIEANTKKICENNLLNGNWYKRYVDDISNNTALELNSEVQIYALDYIDHIPRWINVAKYQSEQVTFDRNQLEHLTNYPAHHDVSGVLKLTFTIVLDEPYTMIHPHREHVLHELSLTCSNGHLCWISTIIDNKLKYIPECCYGYVIDLLLHLKKELNIDPYVYTVADGFYGSKNDGNWSGVIGELVNGKADMALAALTNSAARGEVVDFPEIFLRGGMTFVTIVKDPFIPFFMIDALEPLSIALWLTTFGWVLLASFYLVFSEQVLSYKSKRQYQWRESLSYCFGLMFQRGLGGQNPANFNSRAVSVVIAISTMAIMSSYTAILTAQKITYKVTLPLSGWEDEKIVNPSHAFKFGTYQDSAYSEFFEKSNDPIRRRIGQFMKPYNYKTSEEGIQQLREGKVDAIVSEHYSARYFVSKDHKCSLQYVGNPIKDGGFGLALPKNSPLMHSLSILMRKYQDNGLLRTMELFWFEDTCKNSKLLTEGSVSVLNITYFRGLFLIIIIWIGMSLVVFAFEIFFGWVRKKFYSQPNISLMEASPAQSIESIEPEKHISLYSDVTKIFKLPQKSN